MGGSVQPDDEQPARLDVQAVDDEGAGCVGHRLAKARLDGVDGVITATRDGAEAGRLVDDGVGAGGDEDVQLRRHRAKRS
jgi:hypothetical protein